jgi:hypothetical protein
MDQYFEALADVQRRRLLVALLDHDPQQAEVAIPNDVTEGEKPLGLLQAEFSHSHLPKLEEAGFITWNQDTQKVVKGPNFDEIRPFIELMRDHADELPDDWL